VEDLFRDIESFLKTPPPDEEKLLTEAEVERLILSLATARGDDGFDESEVLEIVRWAEGVRVETTMLKLVLSGLCDVNWIDGEIAVKATELGRQAVDRGKDS